MTTVKDIIKQYLTAHGHDGLCNPYCECGCDVDDLAPCGSMNERECQAAKRVTDEYGETIYVVDERNPEAVITPEKWCTPSYLPTEGIFDNPLIEDVGRE